VRRRTETGYEAGADQGERHVTMKLFATEGRPLSPALVQGPSVSLPGEISRHV